MTTMIVEVYDALKAAGAPEGAAHAAATALADAQTRLDKLEARFRLQQWLIIGVFALILALYLQPIWGAY